MNELQQQGATMNPTRRATPRTDSKSPSHHHHHHHHQDPPLRSIITMTMTDEQAPRGITTTDTPHSNWSGGPFRLPPPPPLVIYQLGNSGHDDDNDAAGTDDNTAKEAVSIIRKDTTNALPIQHLLPNQTPVSQQVQPEDPAQDDGEDTDADDDDISTYQLHQIMEIFPEADLEQIRNMLRRTSLINVMNHLAEGSLGALGEVDSICIERQRRRRSSIESTTTNDNCVATTAATTTANGVVAQELEQIMEIFPNVNVTRGEHLLRRNSISTVLIILASEAESA